MTLVKHPFSWALSAVLLLSVGCSTLQVDDARDVSPSDWLEEGDSPQRANAADVVLQPPLEEVWRYNAGAGFGPGSPLLIGNAVVVATRKGEVHAIDLDRGARRGLSGFGESVEGTPVIANGIIYIPVVLGRRALYAYDLEKASTRWAVQHAPIETGLLYLDGLVYGVDVEGTLRAYDAADGSVRWERALGKRSTVQGAPVAAAGRLFVIDDRGHILALDPVDGSILWEQHLGTPVYTTAAAHAGTLFVPTTRGRFFALDAAQGTVRWRFALPDTTVYFSAPAVSEEEVVFGGSDGVLRSLDPATGRQRWTFSAGEAFGAAPLLAGDVIYAGGMDQKLYALERETGALRWEHQLEGRLRSALAAREGFLVVLSEDRHVYLFKPKDSSYAANE